MVVICVYNIYVFIVVVIIIMRSEDKETAAHLSKIFVICDRSTSKKHVVYFN